LKPIRTFTVTPSLPSALEPLREIAYNLRWSWNHDALDLFQRLDPDLWERSGHNPVLMLGTIDQTQLEAAVEDEGFLAHMERVARDFQSYLKADAPWFRRTHGASAQPMVGYFSAEFGLTECLSIFAGGLGILAGDHLKSASDLGVPLVGVGLLYQQGYFQQRLNEAGWQQEAYVDNDFYNLPISPELRPDGTPVTVEVSFPGRSVHAQVWRAQVGRVALYLLDSNVNENRLEDRDITDQLYGGDVEMRIKQEILLGIGGYRALETLGFEPTVFHMNEGHSAFLALERVCRLMEREQLDFAAAREAASAGLIFTTHTPVAAGHDYFPPELMDRYFGEYMSELHLSRQEFLGLGRQDPYNESERFCMTILALRMASHSNGVSRLHAQVTRRMWQGLWPGVPEAEVPIGHVTNGVHFRSWISQEVDELYDRYLGPRWGEEPGDPAVWRRVERIPTEELWRTHERRRLRLVAYVRRQLRLQLERMGAPRAEVEAAEEVLDPEALTIGFARRFATYKRAYLFLKDPERLAFILNHPERPVQIIVAGKAHPKDEAGKELIRHIVSASREPEFRRRLVFLENYDMAMARMLVQGCDVWLNNPLRPLEASGTSGMKAVANGVLHLSTLDGWWAEAWDMPRVDSEAVGWPIGDGQVYSDPEQQDQVEADALYDLLERDVAPTFYDRGLDGLPRRWIARMKTSVSTLCHFFNTHRMVREYTERFYGPASARYNRLVAEDGRRASELAAWKDRVHANWPQVRVEAVKASAQPTMRVGNTLQARAHVRLGDLAPDDVRVELYLGRVDADGNIVEPRPRPMEPLKAERDGVYVFEASDVACYQSGQLGFTVRVLPHHTDLSAAMLPGFIAWAGPEV
jgi:starch phosphorylase